jgi:hypothetical protein
MNRTALSASFLILLLVGLTASALGGADEPIRLSVRIFQIPAEQSFEVERPDGQGGTFALHVSGNIASFFPRGTVFMPTELAANASASAIGRTMAESVRFGCDDFRAGRVQIRELKALDIRLDAEHPSEGSRFEEGRGEGRTDNYELRAERLPGVPEKPVIRFRFFAGWSAQAGSLGVGISSDVISTLVEVPDSTLLLIGAPGDKAVYVLAVCARAR